MSTPATRLLLALCLLATACAKMRHQKGTGLTGYVGEGSDMIAGLPPAAADSLTEIPGTPVFATATPNAAQIQRKLIWTGDLRVDVDVISNAVLRASHLVEQARGYIQAQNVDDDNAHLTVRVPAEALSPTISALGALGSTTVVRVSSSDITEEYADTEARMKTSRALRDRLQGLLDRATNVTEVLSVERELARVQAEIEAAEARIRAMAGQVNLATLEVYLQRRTPPAEDRRTIYGPVGLVVKGLSWILEKLWVIRE